MQQEASKLSSAFSAGDPSVDVTEVMIALQKAGVAVMSRSTAVVEKQTLRLQPESLRALAWAGIVYLVGFGLVFLGSRLV